MCIHESAEDYLEAILVLSERLDAVHAVDIARHLGVSKPSVSKALENLKREGCVTVDDRIVRLTEHGASIARSIFERHEFFARVLARAGVEEDKASAEACRLEHCLSQDSFDKLRAYYERREATRE